MLQWRGYMGTDPLGIGKIFRSMCFGFGLRLIKKNINAAIMWSP